MLIKMMVSNCVSVQAFELFQHKGANESIPGPDSQCFNHTFELAAVGFASTCAFAYEKTGEFQYKKAHLEKGEDKRSEAFIQVKRKQTLSWIHSPCMRFPLPLILQVLIFTFHSPSLEYQMVSMKELLLLRIW
jgi:hypothetical protein